MLSIRGYNNARNQQLMFGSGLSHCSSIEGLTNAIFRNKYDACHLLVCGLLQIARCGTIDLYLRMYVLAMLNGSFKMKVSESSFQKFVK
jgi:hypothetical protein